MESIQLDRVRPVKPAAGYQGGKKNLARRICAIIDRTGHDGYAEPFVGMSSIFLRRSTRPRTEVVNDLSGDVMTFFRVLQEHYPYFIDMLRWRLASRNEFERLRGMDPTRLTDLQRAARFLYLQRLAWGGKVDGRSFGVSGTTASYFNVTRLEPVLADIHDRLANVVLEQLAYETFIRKYDRPGMLFYLDPPYAGCEDDYGKGAFAPEDHARLATVLTQLRGRFIMSLNDTPGVRETFATFRVQPIATTYMIEPSETRGTVRAGELLISNYELC